MMRVITPNGGKLERNMLVAVPAFDPIERDKVQGVRFWVTPKGNPVTIIDARRVYVEVTEQFGKYGVSISGTTYSIEDATQIAAALRWAISLAEALQARKGIWPDLGLELEGIDNG